MLVRKPTGDYRTGRYSKKEAGNQWAELYKKLGTKKKGDSEDFAGWPDFNDNIEATLLVRLPLVLETLEKMFEGARQVSRKRKDIARRRVLKNLSQEIGEPVDRIDSIFERVSSDNHVVIRKLIVRLGVR